MRRFAFGLAIMLAFVACGGSGGAGSAGGAGGDPVGAVNNVMNAVKAKQFASIAPMICAAKRDAIATSLNPAAALASAAPGVNAQALLDAITIDVANFSATQVSQSGDNAVVAIKGQMTMSFDQAKMKDVVKSILASQQLPTDDATVALAMQSVAANLPAAKPVDSQVNIVRENGVWLVCDSIGS